MTRLGHFLFRYRNALFPLAFALVFLGGPRLFADPVTALGIGAVFAALGETVRVLTIGLEYIIRGGRQRRVYAKDLVTEGLYAHSRNPMYVGNLLVLTGVALASNSLACVAIALPLFTFFHICIVAAEEEFLHATFGAVYEAYARDVPRWVPRLRGLGTTWRVSTFHWRRVLMKEYGTACALFGGLCVLGLVQVSQLDGRHVYYRALLVTMLVTAAIAWIGAWSLKRSHVIVAD
jgi:protein-S-isoprenylcysteine O-methyltransferase Ste14